MAGRNERLRFLISFEGRSHDLARFHFSIKPTSAMIDTSENTPGLTPDRLKDWFERAFEAGCNHFAYHESNRSEYSPDFPEWYEWHKQQIHEAGQPDELAKAQQRVKELEDALQSILSDWEYWPERISDASLITAKELLK